MYRTELSRPDNSGMNMILFETMDGVLREKDFLAERHLFYAIEKCSSEQIFYGGHAAWKPRTGAQAGIKRI